MRIAAKLLKGNKVHPICETNSNSGYTAKVYMDMIKEGITEIFIEAGAVVSTPTVGLVLVGTWVFLPKGKCRFYHQ
jgi:3-isopropylmalate/(R)-2-methylmalate dehydratase large subunit